ncbi:transmembrane protein 53-B isoform X2 [Halyomorpha halys]|uniref:transmembrane protein 53-B isoform X2 n=1 Tax=Halyomorpha halys TaxID=286706 RepID=UPI0006D4D643|nr:transmembrane protein 53-A-like isoform X2 [Halyomorpha halys]
MLVEIIKAKTATQHFEIGMLEAKERKIFIYPVADSIELISYEELVVKPTDKRTPEVILETNRPLVLLLPWLLAKPKHTRKYIELYLDKGFDVLKIQITIWKVLWPVIGSQVVAGDVVEFLHDHEKFQPLFVHGFSAGNYLWSESLVKIAGNLERYKNVMDRIRGQVLDSPPSTPPAFQKGFAIALFPNNPLLSFLFENTITLQLYLFYNTVTKHLINGFQAVLCPPSKVPCLMFISKDDPISPFDRNMVIVEAWKSNGIQAQIKCWDKSQHVGHFVHHRNEYIDQLNTMLESVGLSNLTKTEQDLETSAN